MLKTAFLFVAFAVLFANSSKLGFSLQSTLKTASKADIIVTLKDDTSATLDAINAQRISTLEGRASAVSSSLQFHAASTQASLLSFLAVRKVAVAKKFWINNSILIKNANAELTSALAARKDVSIINLNEKIMLDAPLPAKTLPRNGLLAEWGVDRIQAPEVWALPGGSNGTGVRVAIIDTGVRVTHEALRGNFIGMNGWFDPYDGTPEPIDYMGHGTHVTGTIVGQTNGIGVAPGAQWLACRGCDFVACMNDALLSCAEWIICPTLPDGTSSPDCSKTPHVASNSWGGIGGNRFFESSLRAWLAAGIHPVFAGGNQGPGCETTHSPGDNVNALGIGSISFFSEASMFSSKGPSAFGTLKPDMVAPGQDITSASGNSDTEYVPMSGTSMACPHASGVIALLKGIRSNLSFSEARTLLFNGVTTNLTSPDADCGGLDDSQYPNYAFGHGLMNALNSAQALIG